MRKLLLILAVCTIAQFNSYAQKAKGDYYVVTAQRDTIYCKKVKNIDQPFYRRIKCVLPNGEKKYFKYKDVFSYRAKERDIVSTYEYRPRNPKNPNNNKYFMEVMAKKNEYVLLCYISSGGSAMYANAGGGFTTISSSGSSDYYLYKGDEFIKYVEKDNVSEILVKYFDKCDDLPKYKEEAKSSFHYLDKLIHLYKEHCQ